VRGVLLPLLFRVFSFPPFLPWHGTWGSSSSSVEKRVEVRSRCSLPFPLPSPFFFPIFPSCYSAQATYRKDLLASPLRPPPPFSFSETFFFLPFLFLSLRGARGTLWSGAGKRDRRGQPDVLISFFSFSFPMAFFPLFPLPFSGDGVSHGGIK